MLSNMAESENQDKMSRGDINFAEQVRLSREEQGWSQGDLAQKMGEQGLSYVNQTTVSRIENKTRPVRLMEAQVLSKIFGRTVHSMTNPDSREVFLYFAEQTHRTALRTYVSFKNAVAEMARVQSRAAQELEHLRQLFKNGDDLDPESRLKFDGLIANLGSFIEIDAIEEAADLYAAESRKASS